jgi:hypothetical protein
MHMLPDPTMDMLPQAAATSDADLQEQLRDNPGITALDTSRCWELTYLSLKTIRDVAPSLLTLKLCPAVSVRYPPTRAADGRRKSLQPCFGLRASPSLQVHTLHLGSTHGRTHL